MSNFKRVIVVEGSATTTLSYLIFDNASVLSREGLHVAIEIGGSRKELHIPKPISDMLTEHGRKMLVDIVVRRLLNWITNPVHLPQEAIIHNINMWSEALGILQSHEAGNKKVFLDNII